MERIRTGVLSSPWHICITLPTTKAQGLSWKRKEKFHKSEIVDTCKKKNPVFSGHGRIITHSGCNCYPKTCTRLSQQKKKKKHSMDWWGYHELPCISRKYWQSINARDWWVIFLQGCGPWMVTPAPVDGLTPMYIWAEQSGLWFCFVFVFQREQMPWE